MGLDNGLVSNRQQAIIWTNADLIHWCIYVALGGAELMRYHTTWNASLQSPCLNDMTVPQMEKLWLTYLNFWLNCLRLIVVTSNTCSVGGFNKCDWISMVVADGLMPACLQFKRVQPLSPFRYRTSGTVIFTGGGWYQISSYQECFSIML